ncbi:ribosomal protein L9 [Spizellomyces punctatus DAOM BR117]|uniref:50S ribosomal protein L9, chloroplastic n=1 Tax=Spizellomyces punctatus (strain DAOM BR117) TaxID=645134 RepID=A0A0L0HGV5_SPIPD|nr:ribosomal protein L9 [Spizellomyces punctatus DAOM BR117]KND00691.1 ribosomal protein L9 [Spizellomyces punctatus DAOM BR117]|eukprot:XP_016608730.1 ribosomal protein L9 [Spizellomyces punctatus DAOM BR117]
MALGVRQALRATLALRTLPTRLVYAQRTKFQKPDIHVFLREDIAGIGDKGEIALVNLSTARNYLVPFGLAYYVPRIKGKAVLPDGWEPRIREDDVVLETITPAYSTVKVEQRKTVTVTATNAETSKPTREERAQQEVEKLAALGTIKELVFERVLHRPESTKIYGSVSQEDIIKKLLAEHGVSIDRDAVQLETKIKDVGVYKVTVSLGDGFKPVDVDIIVRGASTTL